MNSKNFNENVLLLITTHLTIVSKLNCRGLSPNLLVKSVDMTKAVTLPYLGYNSAISFASNNFVIVLFRSMLIFSNRIPKQLY